jgi:hypothetical protein
MMPPKNIGPSTLFQKLMEMPTPSEVIDFPRKGVNEKVRINMLPMSKHNAVRIQGQEWLSRAVSQQAINGTATTQVLGDRVAAETVCLTITEVDPIPGSEATGRVKYRQVFARPDDVLDCLTADEIAAFFTAYNMLQVKYGPTEANVTEEGATAWVKRLAEGASNFPLSLLVLEDLRQLTYYLATRLYTLSATIDFLSSNLPPTLIASLRKWNIGTGFFTLRAADSSIVESLDVDVDSLPEIEPEADTEPITSKDPILMSDAIRIAKQMKDNV